MQRIGVFVCHCGTNIAGTVDVVAVAEALSHEPGVVISEEYQYMCSEAGQNKIKDAIKANDLTGIVVCSCSPSILTPSLLPPPHPDSIWWLSVILQIVSCPSEIKVGVLTKCGGDWRRAL